MTIDADTRLRAADPASTAGLAALDVGSAAAALRDAILDAEITSGPAPAPAARRRPARRRLALVAATAVLGIAAAVGFAGLGVLSHGGSSTSGQAWGAAAIRLANSVPRQLVGLPGWAVDSADASGNEGGSMVFRSGRLAVELDWYPKEQADERYRDRASGTTHFPAVAVEGTSARVYRYSAASQDYAALWTGDDWLFELRTQTDIPEPYRSQGIPEGDPNLPVFTTHFDAARFRAVVASMHAVSVDAWLGAIPASVVRPNQQEDTVREMLRRVPVPAGFDPSSVVDATTVRDRYQLGARVTGAVACAWIDQWIAATKRGDAASQREAVASMATARHWPILLEMQQGGAFPQVLWEYANRLTATSAALGAGRPAGQGIGDFRSGLCSS